MEKAIDNHYFRVSRDSLVVGFNGGAERLFVECSEDWYAAVEPSYACTIEKDGDTLAVNVSPNPITRPINSRLIIRSAVGDTITVPMVQVGKPASKLDVKQTSIAVSWYGGSSKVDVSTDDLDFSIEGLPDWCKVADKFVSIYDTCSYFKLSFPSNPSRSVRRGRIYVSAAGKIVGVDISQEGKKRVSTGSGYRRSSRSKSFSYNEDSILRFGLDANVDVDDFLALFENGEYSLNYSVGIKIRLGRYDQLLNLISGASYSFGDDTGFRVPALLNVNLLRNHNLDMAMYLGGGYELAFSDYYRGSTVLQYGLCGKHADLCFYYKLKTDAIGVGLTYYF